MIKGIFGAALLSVVSGKWGPDQLSVGLWSLAKMYEFTHEPWLLPV